MLRTELKEIIYNGESSGVELKRDDIKPGDLAKEMAALLNLEGGHILLGVEDDGSVSGLTRGRVEAEEWVMEAARIHLQPPIIPFWETIPWDDDHHVGIVTLPADSPDKPYKAKQGNAWVTMMRVGTTSRPASREEEARLYQSSGMMRYDLKVVPGSSLADLDLQRLQNYFRDIRGQDFPEEADEGKLCQLLVNTDFMLEQKGLAVPTTGAMLLVGRNPNRFLPQAGITAVAYPGDQKDYTAKQRGVLRGAIVPLLSEPGEILENGLVDQAMSFVKENTKVEGIGDDGRRKDDFWTIYPREAVRETIVNAIAHRDYTITVTDIELSIYSDRLEVISPGNLPNTVTVEKMRTGYRATRNELIKEVLRDYRYIEATGLGVPRKIIRGMLSHNGKEPDLVEEEDRFTVRLWA